MATVEEELKRLKASQNVDEEQAIRRRKDVLVMARQERLKATGDDGDNGLLINAPTGMELENSNDDEDEDENESGGSPRHSMRSTQKRTQSSTARGATTRGRGRGRGRAKTTPTTTPRAKRKPF